MKPSPLGVGILGAGTVGAAVVRGLPALGDRFEIVAIAVRDVDAARDRGLPGDFLTDAPAHVVADPGVDVVVELLGGDEPARTLVLAALQAGKPVVTANKHLLAHHGAELEAAARRSGAPLRFEASVGGGIPVLSPLAADLAANRIHSVRGIVNGTTNYILSAMAAGEGTYESVLTDAQQRGYAEADPRGDVEGRDAVNKLVVLARLAFGEWLEPECVTNRPATAAGSGAPGITGVTATELQAAADMGLAIRLLATAVRGEGGTVQARVVPTTVPRDSALGRTSGVRNRIEVQAQPVGLVGFDGPGAGGEATSSAVLGDLAAIAAGLASTWAALPPARTAQPASSAVPNMTGDGDTTIGQWFALLPGVRTADVAALDIVQVTRELASGVAVRTNDVALGTLRSTILDVLPQAKSVPWYPIDA